MVLFTTYVDNIYDWCDFTYGLDPPRLLSAGQRQTLLAQRGCNDVGMAI